MYLIDIQRGIVDLALAGLEGGVRPTESPDIIQLAGGSRTGLHVEAIGVGLVAGFTILTGNCIFIDVILPQAGDKSLPNLPPSGEAVCSLIPAVKVPHDGYVLRVGRPNAKDPSAFVPSFCRMCSKPMPSVCQGACVKLCSLVVIRHSMLLSPAAAAAGSVFFNWSFFPYYTAYGKERQGSAFQKPRYFSFFLLDTIIFLQLYLFIFINFTEVPPTFKGVCHIPCFFP